ncbi:homeobox domain protein [Ceratobasidium sp. AG-Ba]|nr:homeobox domain protein [Ceratobasidium sp. AG-Ba]
MAWSCPWTPKTPTPPPLAPHRVGATRRQHRPHPQHRHHHRGPRRGQVGAPPEHPPQLPTELESPLSPPSAESTPSQSATFSAVPPPRTRSATIASPLRGPLDSISDEQKPSSIGPSATSTAAGLPGSSRANIQKRKRSRVTPSSSLISSACLPGPESDRCPPQGNQRAAWDAGAPDSDLVPEQARQGKARRVQGALRSSRLPRLWSRYPPRYAPELSPGYEADLQALLHETEPISIIPCTDLTIGSWHRIADRTGRHDLVAYISDHKASLTWFIHSGGHGFKMEIPISTVLNADFSHSSQLARWQVCDDWTEGRQASHIKAQLVGSAVQLSHAIRVFEARRQNPGMLMGRGMGPGMAQMGYPNVEAPRPVSMQIPQPPLSVCSSLKASINFPSRLLPPCSPFLRTNAARAFHATHGRKRSYSGPPAYHDPPTEVWSSSTPSSNSRCLVRLCRGEPVQLVPAAGHESDAHPRAQPHPRRPEPRARSSAPEFDDRFTSIPIAHR